MRLKDKIPHILFFVFLLVLNINFYIKAFLDIETYREIYAQVITKELTTQMSLITFSLGMFLLRNKISNFMATKYKKYSLEYYKFIFTLFGGGFFILGTIRLLFVLYLVR